MGAARTRVAVVQLAYHPAILVHWRSPLEDPLFKLGEPDSLSASGKELPEVFAPRLEALRRRIRETYDAQLLGRVQAILAACRTWKVEVVAFPEYSIPWEILGGVADAAGEMVVVAGTHTVERAAKKSGVYEHLALPREAMPVLGQSIAPVLHRGRLLGLSAKLNPSQHESQMRPGGAWTPIEMPGGIPGPVGILVCLDFLYRESTEHRAHVAESMERCRFLTVPSLTPGYTLPEFVGKAWEEARRYGRPVLYCDGAEGGGTSIYVDEGRQADLRSFPEHVGLLEADDEGVIVADVDLGYERPGRSTRYAGSQPVVPVAAATLVYRANPTAEAYARWLEEAGPLLSRNDDEAVEALAERVQLGRDTLLNAGALSGCAARKRRLSRLVREIEKVTSVEEIRLLTREVVVPAGVLPLPALRAGMAKGAADAVFAWMKERRGGGLEEVERRLREAGQAAKIGDAGSWTREGVAAIEEAALAVRGEIEEAAKVEPVEVPVRAVLPTGVDPAALGARPLRDGFCIEFRPEPDRFRARVKHERGSVEFASDAWDMTGVWSQTASDLYLLAVAEGRQRVTAVAMATDLDHPQPASGGVVVIIMGASQGWELWVDAEDSWWATHGEAAREALEAEGLIPLTVTMQTGNERPGRVARLLPRIEGARATIEGLHVQRLQEVNGCFEEPSARVGDGERRPLLATLDEWILSADQTALVLGEFGSGKSTALAVWADQRWPQDDGPKPILVNLASASPARDAEGLLLDAAAAQDTRENRAALRLLVRYRFVVPCFDGFDEIATRLGAADLAGRLSALLQIARGGPGQVLVSCRDNYFSTNAQLTTATESALHDALGETKGVRRITLNLFDAKQVEELVRKVSATPEAAKEALGRIEQTYDLRDLVKRPLLLGMVLATLDRIAPAAAVGTADLYEAYLQRWLDQTRSRDPECFSDAQKIEFAEALADDLWRSGQASRSWQELQGSVRARLGQYLLETEIPAPAAYLEIQGGAFFVRQGEDRYRFAHKSFLEYFLARGLGRTLPERPAEALATRPITREVAAFVGEVLRREGDPKQAKAVKAVQKFLTAGRTQHTSGAPELKRLAPAIANALRLLLGLARWSQDRGGWIPEGADLRGGQFAGEDLRGAWLVGARLEGAELSRADLSDADLRGAVLDRARLHGTCLHRAVLRKASARGADFLHAEADGADLEGADMSGAVLRQSTWTRSRWDGVTMVGAQVTAWIASGCTGQGVNEHSLKVDAAGVHPVVTRWPWQTAHCGAWNADLTQVVLGGDDGFLHLWSMPSNAPIARVDAGGRAIFAIAWSHDGASLASAGADGIARVFEAETGAEIQRAGATQGSLRTLSWSPGGDLFVGAGDEGVLRVWRVSDGAEVARLVGHQGAVASVAWSPDGDWIASGGSDGSVRLWDVTIKAEIARLAQTQGAVRAVAWRPGGGQIAAAGDDPVVRVWDAATRRLLRDFAGHSAPVQALAWSAGGESLAGASHDGTIRTWSMERGGPSVEAVDTWSRLPLLTPAWAPFIAIAWDRDEPRLLSINARGSVYSWDAVTGERGFNPLPMNTAGTDGLAWSPDGGRLACMRASSMSISLWDVVDTGKVGALLRATSVHHPTALTWSPANSRLLVGGAQGSISLLDTEDGSTVSTFMMYADAVNALSWSSDGTLFASAHDNGRLWIWDPESTPDPVVPSVTMTHVDGLTSQVKSSPLRRPLPLLSGHHGRGRALAWHPTKKWLATAEEGGVQLFRINTARSSISKRISDVSVHMLAWNADGSHLAGCGHGVWLWSGPRRAEVRLPWTASVLAWHPQQARLASAGKDGMIRFWNAESMAADGSIDTHKGAIRSLIWDPQGERLATVDHEGFVHIWGTVRGDRIVTLDLSEHASIVSTPGGFCLFGDSDRLSCRLALRRPEPGSRTEFYLPLAGFREVLHHPDKVKAALAGDLSEDDLGAELARRGFSGGVAWDGALRRFPEDARPGMSKAVEQQSKTEMLSSLGALSKMLERQSKMEELLSSNSAARNLHEVLSNSAVSRLQNSAVFQLQNSAVFQLERQMRALGTLPKAASKGTLLSAASEALGTEDDVLAAVTLEAHNDMPNLFRPGPALADTAAFPPGREPIIARLLDHLRRGMPTVLRGHRRSGKTSILRHLAHRLTPGAAYATLEGRRIKTAVDLVRVFDPSLKGDDAANIFRDRLRAEPSAVLLLDEISHLRDAEPDLFAWIRAVGQDGIGVILSGSPWDWTQIVHHAAKAPGSSFSNDITPVDLGPLAEADAIRFLVDTAPAEIPIEADKTARWIVDRCGAWPFYLQVMGDALVRAVLAGNRRALVEAPGVSDLYEQGLFAAHDGSFQVRWEELPAAAQAIVRTIRGLTKPIYKDLGRDAQKILRDTGLCDARGQWIDDRPFFEWIQRTITRSTKPPPAGSAPEGKENDMIPKLPKPLIDAYKKGKLALFIGSGFSRGTGVKGDFPGWKDLPERLLAACAKYSVQDDKWIEKKRDLFQGRMRLEEMLAELGVLRTALDRDYQAALHDIFSPKDAAPGAAHRAVAALAVPAVLTTNYDQLLEAADPLPGRQPYTRRHADRALSTLRGGRKVLLKVHGSVEDHESVVMSNHDYDAARSDPSYQAVLRFLLQDSMFLFVGYGMNDPLDLDLAFKANADAFRTSTQKHFVLLRNPLDIDADRYHREYRVEVLPYSEHDEVTAFLEGLAHAGSAGP